MTTGGEGGMVTTNDESLWRTMWAHKDHGKSYEAVYEREHPPGYRWLHESFGTNWRMLEIQAAIGRIQLRRMPDWTSRRNENAQLLTCGLDKFIQNGLLRVPAFQCSNECIKSGNGRCCKSQGPCKHAYYKYYAYLNVEKLTFGWNRDRIIDSINDSGVPCYSGSCSEVYLEKAFDKTGFRPEKRLPIAKELGEDTLMFLVHPTICAEDIVLAATKISKILNLATSSSVL